MIIPVEMKDQKYEIINRGVSGDTISKMYAKIKLYAWNDKPDYLSIFIGTNDVCRELNRGEDFDAQRFISSYRMLIEMMQNNIPGNKVLLQPSLEVGDSTKRKL